MNKDMSNTPQPWGVQTPQPRSPQPQSPQPARSQQPVQPQQSSQPQQPTGEGLTKFESALAKMQGGVIYTLVCAVNSVFITIAFLLIAVLTLNAFIPDEGQTPTWTRINAYMLWADRIAAKASGQPVPASMEDISFNHPLTVALFMVMIWVPFAVFALVAAIIASVITLASGKGSRNGVLRLRSTPLGWFAVIVNLPGRLWTLLMRLLFSWIFKNKVKLMAFAVIPGKYRRLAKQSRAGGQQNPYGGQYGNRYGNPYGPDDDEPGLEVPGALVIKLILLFLLTVVVWGISAMPYIFPIIGVMTVASPIPPDAIVVFAWSVAVAFIGLTFGIWFPGICDFYRRYGVHLSVRERFDWYPLTPSGWSLRRKAEAEREAMLAAEMSGMAGTAGTVNVPPNGPGAPYAPNGTPYRR
ncbi:hypothetical protein D2E25_1997 [Bifidobacterium goeldii]|uniref:Uncharacterized protein n=1 Tax=Bifidobacterium goeldii TaxID=2306975 RepID=A0A430FCQ9_9BIFI|nr:hypothetical protein [Bifidobacterium goeldii]RSX50591.1 hypothetical protein D2E25_1997 [Bifidobacterium goeldii]